jgi:hypothetical protein
MTLRSFGDMSNHIADAALLIWCELGRGAIRTPSTAGADEKAAYSIGAGQGVRHCWAGHGTVGDLQFLSGAGAGTEDR